MAVDKVDSRRVEQPVKREAPVRRVVEDEKPKEEKVERKSEESNAKNSERLDVEA